MLQLGLCCLPRRHTLCSHPVYMPEGMTGKYGNFPCYDPSKVRATHSVSQYSWRGWWLGCVWQPCGYGMKRCMGWCYAGVWAVRPSLPNHKPSFSPCVMLCLLCTLCVLCRTWSSPP